MRNKAINCLSQEFKPKEVADLLGLDVDIVYEVLTEQAQVALSQDEIDSLLTQQPECLFSQ